MSDVVSYCVVNTVTGKVERYGSAPAHAIEVQAFGADEIAMESDARDDTHYYDGMEIVARTPLSEFDVLTVPADGVTLATVTGLPNPTTATITGPASDSFIVTDGVLALSFDTPGAYVVQMDAGVVYLLTRVTINAT